MCELMHCWQKTGCVKPAHKQHQATNNDYSSYCIHHFLQEQDNKQTYLILQWLVSARLQ